MERRERLKFGLSVSLSNNLPFLLTRINVSILAIGILGI